MSGSHVALLRGINVGTAKRVSMADLRALVERLGYTDVTTLLNSGNVVFTAQRTGDHAATIENAIASRLGITSRVTVLSAAELKAVAAGNSLLKVANNHSRLMVTFLTEPKLASTLGPLAKQKWSPEAIVVGKRAVYIWTPEGILESKLFKAFGKLLGDAGTTRNWATVTKLLALTQ